jgi:hypothetical protein
MVGPDGRGLPPGKLARQRWRGRNGVQHFLNRVSQVRFLPGARIRPPQLPCGGRRRFRERAIHRGAPAGSRTGRKRAGPPMGIVFASSTLCVRPPLPIVRTSPIIGQHRLACQFERPPCLRKPSYTRSRRSAYSSNSAASCPSSSPLELASSCARPRMLLSAPRTSTSAVWYRPWSTKGMTDSATHESARTRSAWSSSSASRGLPGGNPLLLHAVYDSWKSISAVPK